MIECRPPSYYFLIIIQGYYSIQIYSFELSILNSSIQFYYPYTCTLMDKFKIEIILRSSPEKLNLSKQKQKKFPVYNYQQGVLYSRSPSTTVSAPYDNHINLREKIVNPKQCFVRPASKKQKQSQMFTDKCLEILSKKRTVDPNSAHHAKMHAMMTNVVDKYRRAISYNKNELVATNSYKKQFQLPKAQEEPPMLMFSDKIEVYRMIKSTQISRNKEQAKSNKKEGDWRARPDVTGVRMNKILKFQTHQFQGVQCFSLPISELPITKRQSLIMNQTNSFQPQPRAASSNSYRRKVSIGRINSQKFMAFSSNADSDALYMKKLKSFLDFIFKVNYSNKIYISLQLSEDTTNIKKYKVFIGKGNNSLLIKSLLKRRFWLQIVEDVDDEDINFYWTQNKLNKVHYKQKTSKFLKIAREQKHTQKRKQLKDAEEKQTIELNKKILPTQECSNVEQFVCKDGYFMPQSEKYICNIVSNHVPRNSCIGSKKNLFKSLFHYYKDYLKTDPFDFIPKTYNVKGPEDPQFKRFLKEYQNEQKKVWIIKPGENSNRGNGIKLCQTTKVIDLIRRKQKHENGQTKTYIIQSYIDRPFLYNGRKFDIRHYMMLTSVNGIIKAYWYKEGYIRTSSQKYDIEDLENEQMHLTNDAIQKKYEQYEKYEPGNKLSYPQFQRYLDLTYPNKGFYFQRDIIPKMKSIILDVIKANYIILDKSRRQCNFQIFGFDFMIDRDFKPWLIQINFNPCLEINCPVLSRIIPIMVQNSLRIGLDPLLPPCNHYPGNKRFSLSDNFLKNLKYELIFDQLSFEETIPMFHDIDDSDDQQQQYNDDGKEIQELLI